jgi:hypothetical protein
MCVELTAFDLVEPVAHGQQRIGDRLGGELGGQEPGQRSYDSEKQHGRGDVADLDVWSGEGRHPTTSSPTSGTPVPSNQAIPSRARTPAPRIRISDGRPMRTRQRAAAPVRRGDLVRRA